MRRFAPLTTILLGITVGCGDQAPPDYQGETLGNLSGVLVSELAQPLPEVDVVIGWPDWSKGDATSAPIASFLRLPVDAKLPARFSATILEAPPPTAYYTPPANSFPKPVGPRYASAIILLARKGLEVTDSSHLALNLALANPNEAVLTRFDDYMLTYFESSGTPGIQLDDGTTVPLSGPTTKGFHLVRQDRVVCALSYDEACIAQNIAHGFSEKTAWGGCVSTTERVTAVEVPLDTEITLTLKDPTAEEERPPLCPTPAG